MSQNSCELDMHPKTEVLPDCLKLTTPRREAQRKTSAIHDPCGHHLVPDMAAAAHDDEICRPVPVD
jgi:hypothetical protein